MALTNSGKYSPLDTTTLWEGCYHGGLYLANRVVSQQGGQCLIEENSPHGTVVTVELPKLSAQSQNRSNEFRSISNSDTDPTH